MKKPLSTASHRKERQPVADIEQIAASGLTFLAADPERLERFLAATGLTPATLRAAARSRGFGEGLLDYLAGDERLFTAFANEHGHDPARLEAFRHSLASPADDG